MTKINPWKIGIGAGLILFGAYIALSSQGQMIEVIIGIISAALGVSLIAAN